MARLPKEKRKIFDRIKELNENPSNYNYKDQLNEKGVEYTILMPLVEKVWEFDPLKHVAYEKSSAMNGKRFDLLIGEKNDFKFLIEAKSLDTNLFKKKPQDQIKDYIKKNKEIKYGFLTNGVDFHLFLAWDFIRDSAKSNADEDLNLDINPASLAGTEDPTLTVAKFSPATFPDNFHDVLHSFQKGKHQTVARQIARFVCAQYRKGNSVNKLIESSKANEQLKNNIQQTLNIDRGELLDRVSGENADLEPGEVLVYQDENQYFYIPVEVRADGQVQLLRKRASIRFPLDEEMSIGNIKIQVSDVKETYDQWQSCSDQELVYNDPRDILKELWNRKRLDTTLSEMFQPEEAKRKVA